MLPLRRPLTAPADFIATASGVQRSRSRKARFSTSRRRMISRVVTRLLTSFGLALSVRESPEGLVQLLAWGATAQAAEGAGLHLLAADSIADHATRARAPPTLIRRTPRSARSPTLRSAPITRTLSGLGATARTIAAMSALAFTPGA